MRDTIKASDERFPGIFQVARLRYRAEEARVIAEDMDHWDAREMMLRIAKDYEDLADSLERPTRDLQ